MNGHPDIQPIGISEGEVYPLETFKARMGIGDCVMRRLRSLGLPVQHLGERKLAVDGRAAIEFIRSLPAAGEAAAAI